MKAILYMGAAAVALTTTFAASAQFLGKEDNAVTAPRIAEPYWSAKPTTPTSYDAPNKVHWKLSEILAAHRGQADWTQPIVRNREQDADYISLGAGKTTKRKMYADDRVVFIVQDGAIKVSIDGYDPFTATKGFMVNVPYRHYYSLQTEGDKPSLRFEVRQAGSPPLYPGDVQPDPYPGRTYVKVTGSPGPSKEKESNPIYVDFWKQVASGDQPYNGKFVWDDHFTSNILRGKAQQTPPASNKGHFHVDWMEFWFIMEGKVDYQIEGYPLFTAEQGDVVEAAKGRWHRPSNNPNAPMSTRIPFNPRPPIFHNFAVDPQPTPAPR
jgi:mannose-6-phosphate isomerase-like protein (cupin superfamily)